MLYMILALVAFVLAIVMGVIKKNNIGIFAIALAYFIAKFAGWSDKEVYAGFSTSLFLMIFGIMFLFNMCQQNDTISVLIQKILKKIGKQTWAIPLVMVICFTALSYVGGGYAVMALSAVLSLSLAKELKISPLPYMMLGGFGYWFGNGFRMGVQGMVQIKILEEHGFANALEISNRAQWGSCIVFFIMFVVLYFFYKCHKIKPTDEFLAKEVPAFTTKQKFTLLWFLVFIVVVIVMPKWNPGMVALAVGLLIGFCGLADEKIAITKVPWNTLMLLCGVGVLVNVIAKTGGIAVITEWAVNNVPANWVVPFFALVSAVFSCVATMSSVVVPTILPVIISVSQTLGISVVPMMVAMISAGYIISVSPMSTGGAMMIAAQTQVDENADTAKNFRSLLITAICLGAFAILLSIVGLCGIIK